MLWVSLSFLIPLRLFHGVIIYRMYSESNFPSRLQLRSSQPGALISKCRGMAFVILLSKENLSKIATLFITSQLEDARLEDARRFCYTEHPFMGRHWMKMWPNWITGLQSSLRLICRSCITAPNIEIGKYVPAYETKPNQWNNGFVT